MTKIEQAILKTLAFFAIFSRPLTLEELGNFLFCQKASQIQLLIGLKKLIQKKLVGQEVQYFFLKSSKIVEEFKPRQALCRKRWQKVSRIVKVLKWAPFIKNISVINSLSFGASTENSDIDILIIARKNRLWTVRAFAVLILEVLGQNKNKWYQAGKFCLGFAFDETRLALESLRLKSPAGDDIYFTYWLAQLTPVFDRGIYRNLIEQNKWLFGQLPNWSWESIAQNSLKKSILEKMLAGQLGDKLEGRLAKIQIKRIWADRENRRSGASVVADQSMLKLHPYDKRKIYQKQWRKSLCGLDRK